MLGRRGSIQFHAESPAEDESSRTRLGRSYSLFATLRLCVRLFLFFSRKGSKNMSGSIPLVFLLALGFWPSFCFSPCLRVYRTPPARTPPRPPRHAPRPVPFRLSRRWRSGDLLEGRFWPTPRRPTIRALKRVGLHFGVTEDLSPRRRTSLSPQQPVQPRRLLRLIEAFEHPDIVRPFGDSCEEALAVGCRLNPAMALVDAGRSGDASILSAPVFTSIA
jgi:hypothetical protein